MPVSCRPGSSSIVAFGALSGVVAGAGPAWAEAELGVAPHVWVGGWTAAVGALAILYAFDRRHRASRSVAAQRVSVVPMTRDHIVTASEPDPAPASAPRRTIDQLIKRKPGASADGTLPFPLRSPEQADAPAEPAPAPDTALLRRLRERGELIARAAAPVELLELEEADELDEDEEDEPEEDELDEPEEDELDEPEEDEPESGSAKAERDDASKPAAERTTDPGPLARCIALRETGHLRDAVRIAREGLARYTDAPGPLLLELSRATFALGRYEEAIDSARDALFVWRSPETVEHLIRILTALHGFEPEDGDGLRRAVLRHPAQPLLRHAAGVYELSHGSRGTAEAELRTALDLDPDPEQRAAIERDLRRLLGPAAAA